MEFRLDADRDIWWRVESNLLDIDVANQPIPSPSPSDEKLPILEKENTRKDPGSTLLDSDFNAVLETKSSELLESTQTSIVEKQEEHEASSTEPSETTTSTPQNDTIFDVSETCDSDSICYVAPKNCTTNCEVIYAVSEKFKNSTIYPANGDFEASGYCWKGYEDGIINYDRPNGYISYPERHTNWRQEPEHKNWWSFALGKGRKMEFRIDADRDVAGGPFKDQKTILNNSQFFSKSQNLSQNLDFFLLVFWK
ncbi:unnamed protein product [Caenorhabditis nigoni]